MDNKVRRTLAAVISAAMVASAACVPSFASGTQPTATPAPAATTTGQAAAPQSENLVAKIKDGKSYFSLREAIDAANPGDTIQVLQDVTESVPISKKITLTSADPAKPATIRGTITFGVGSDGSKVTGLKFECGKAFSVDQSIKVVSASNVTISGNKFVISDDASGEGVDSQFTSIWLSCDNNVATSNTIISNNKFSFTNCPNGYSNVAIALQIINATKHPDNTTIKGNTFTSTSVPNDPEEGGNAIGIMVMGAEGTLTIGGKDASDSNTFTETLEGGTSNFQGVTLGGDVNDAQIQNNSFDCYIGVHMLRQSWGDQFAGPIKNVTITENQFNGKYGVYTNSTSTGEGGLIESPFEESSTVTVSDNTGSAENTNETGYYVNSETTLKQALTDAPAGTVIKW